MHLHCTWCVSFLGTQIVWAEQWPLHTCHIKEIQREVAHLGWQNFSPMWIIFWGRVVHFPPSPTANFDLFLPMQQVIACRFTPCFHITPGGDTVITPFPQTRTPRSAKDRKIVPTTLDCKIIHQDTPHYNIFTLLELTSNTPSLFCSVCHLALGKTSLEEAQSLNRSRITVCLRDGSVNSVCSLCVAL